MEIGRWKGVDPVYQAHESPYASMGNNPVSFTDVLVDDIDYGSRKQKRDIKYLRKTDPAYEKWWKENAAKYENDKGNNLVVNIIAGRNDLKHSELQSERYSDGKETGNAYLYYNGTLDHREYGIIPKNVTRMMVQGTSSNGTQYTDFSFNLVATLPTFKRWEASVEEESVYNSRPSGSLKNANLRQTVYIGRIGATASKSYDQFGARDQPGYSEAYIIFTEIGSPVYFNQTKTSKGWGSSKSLSLPDHRTIIPDVK